jgi:tRNA nucleotidyltransferase (CCA-adding enzyme)
MKIDIIEKLNIRQIKGFEELNSKSNGIYLVGGIVRDFFLKKDSKDIDIVVCGLSYDEISIILSKHGEVMEVGKSFGVLKYKPFGWIGEPIDIAIPRKDYKLGEGHQGFRIETDPFLPIEQELNRRDFTINSIAISLDNVIVDPFNGIDDIESKIIRATSKQAFSEDPLRMMRAIQFSSRFGFDISTDTWDMIIENKSDIKTISGERIIEELDKIFFKGDIKLGLDLFQSSGLHKELFKSSMICDLTSNIKTREDFFFTICASSEDFRNILKGDIKTIKGIKAIEKCFETKTNAKKSEIRQKLFDAIQISEMILECGRIPFFFKDVVIEFKTNKFPKSFKELALNGDDLIELGFKGKEIGDRLHFLLEEIFEEKRKNNIEDLKKK